MSRYEDFPASMTSHAGFYLPLSGGEAFLPPEEVCDMLAFYDYVPLYACLEAEELDIFSCYEKLNPSFPCCVLESLSGRENNRYSILAFHALKILAPPLQDGNLDQLKSFFSEAKAYKLNLPFFYGGLIGFFNYEAGLVFQDLKPLEPDRKSCFFFLPGKVLVYDRLEKRLYGFLWLTKGKKGYGDVISAYAELDVLLEQARECIKEEETGEDLRACWQDGYMKDFMSSISREKFCQMVAKAKEYINKGDIFQVVLSRRLCKKSRANPRMVYRNLRRINPSPYMFYLEFADGVLLGASPEMMVKIDGNIIKTRPIAGTRKISSSNLTEKDYAELLEDEKEKAEHLMLVDLGRNDIGRVSQPGTVEVEEFFKPELYSHVMHIVSTVRGVMEEDKDAWDGFAACFPAGTLTGAPKRRAMEIINELEGEERGFYGGAVGYINFDGFFDSCITIRAIWEKDGTYYLQSGAGIVADSVPEKEFEETLNKAKALILAIRKAEEEEA